MTDLAITFDGNINQLHFSTLLHDGDLATDDSLKTAVMYSIFTDAHANPDDELPDGGSDYRGHWADNLLSETEGSRLWLLRREKQTQTTLNRAETYAREALTWLIEDGLATKVEVSTAWWQPGWMIITIVIWLNDEIIFSETFNAE